MQGLEVVEPCLGSLERGHVGEFLKAYHGIEVGRLLCIGQRPPN